MKDEVNFRGLTLTDGMTVWVKENIPPCKWQECRVNYGWYSTMHGTYLYFQPQTDRPCQVGQAIAAGNVANISLTL